MTTNTVSSQILSRLVDRIGRPAWLGFSDADRALVEACCVDAAELQLKLLASGAAPAADSIAREKAHIAAQLANLSAASGVTIEAALWRAASSLFVRTGIAVLTGV